MQLQDKPPHARRQVTVGAVFGRWTVTGDKHAGKVLCRCECGKERSVFSNSLTGDKSKSCGCMGSHIGEDYIPVTDEDFAAIRSAAGNVELKAIPGFSGYVLTSSGVVYSVRRRKQKPTVPFRALRFMRHSGGYPQVNMRARGKGHIKAVHRLVAELFLPPKLPEDAVVRHLDGNPENNDVSNLAWGTQADNHADSVRHGTVASGERNGQAKVTEADIPKIRFLHASGVALAIIAKAFGLEPSSIRSITTRENWSSVA